LKLKSSLSVREQELSRAGRLIGDAANTLLNDSTNDAASLHQTYYESIANSSQVIDAANKRIIDQLNGQVDFLNDQLAQREAQLAMMAMKWSTIEQMESDLNLR
jgi:hypothetical protein